MNRGNRIKSIILFIIGIAAAVAIGALVLMGGVLNKVNRVSRGVSSATAEAKTPQQAKAEAAAAEKQLVNSVSEEPAGPDTLDPEEVLFDVDRIDMMDDDDIKNILLIGQDAREGEERQRSDSMIICSINTQEDKITLVSLMRDMYVPIPGYSANRINAAYALGGMELLDATIEQDFGIPIDGNIEVDFEGFVDAMEVIGGVDVELTAEEAGYLSAGGWEDQGDNQNDGTWDLHEGMNTLEPAQALAFARIRHVGNSDWERTDRQRRVIISAFGKISASSTAKLLSIADNILPYITTDLSGNELLSYVKTLSVNGITDVDSYRLPADGHYSCETINGMSVLVPDLVMNSQLLKNYIYGADVDPELKTHNYVPEVKETRPTTTPVTAGSSAPAGTGNANPGTAYGGYTGGQPQTYVAPAAPDPVTTDPGTVDPVTVDPGTSEPTGGDAGGDAPAVGPTGGDAGGDMSGGGDMPAVDAGGDAGGGGAPVVDAGGGEVPVADVPVVDVPAVDVPAVDMSGGGE